jgi:cytochrome c biogenesis protein CcdA
VDEWIRQTLSAGQHGFAVLPAAFMLGVLGSVSSCCTLPVLGAVAGYAGSVGGQTDRRGLLPVALSFMMGTIVSLAVLGAVTGLLGHVAGAALGKYWRLVGGLVMVVFGVATMRLIQIPLPSIGAGLRKPGGGLAGAVVYGLAVGGATTACAVLCNPLIPVAMGAAGAQGAPVLGAAMLASFAVGYSLPLTVGLVGIGFGLGRLGRVADRVMPVVRVGVGLLLVGIGFYLLAPA